MLDLTFTKENKNEGFYFLNLDYSYIPFGTGQYPEASIWKLLIEK